MPKKGYEPGWANTYVQTGTESETGRDPLLTWEPTPPATHPINYFVPDFGVSHEIGYTQKNIANAEKSLKHEMMADFSAKKADVNPRDYFVPNFGQDPEITTSLKNLKDQEAIHGDWIIPVEAPKTWARQTPGPYVSTTGPPNALIAGTDPITLTDPFSMVTGNR